MIAATTKTGTTFHVVRKDTDERTLCGSKVHQVRPDIGSADCYTCLKRSGLRRRLTL